MSVESSQASYFKFDSTLMIHYTHHSEHFHHTGIKKTGPLSRHYGKNRVCWQMNLVAYFYAVCFTFSRPCMHIEQMTKFVLLEKTSPAACRLACRELFV